MISKFLSFVNTKGSSLLLPAHGWVGARATSLLAAHFALRNTASNSAEKKGSPSEGVAEGGDILCQYPLHDKVNLFLVIVSLLMLKHHINDVYQFSL